LHQKDIVRESRREKISTLLVAVFAFLRSRDISLSPIKPEISRLKLYDRRTKEKFEPRINHESTGIE